MKAMQAAQRAARNAIEATYFGSLTVTEHQKVKDEQSKLTGFKDVIVLDNQPCSLSFEKLQSAIQSNSAAAIIPVSYTHLDVYKRQAFERSNRKPSPAPPRRIPSSKK